MKKLVKYVIDEPYYCPFIEHDDIDSDYWWCPQLKRRAPCSVDDFGDSCPLEDAE